MIATCRLNGLLWAGGPEDTPYGLPCLQGACGGDGRATRGLAMGLSWPLNRFTIPGNANLVLPGLDAALIHFTQPGLAHLPRFLVESPTVMRPDQILFQGTEQAVGVTEHNKERISPDGLQWHPQEQPPSH